ncbi:MAG: hypothetical protein JWN34_6274 [Bryobacterales bacterium]|nr:hypothetical protein [Bryobacterales bacterium]
MEGWLTDERWDIEAIGDGLTAIPPPPGIPETVAVRLRVLLEERFLLKVHREIQERPVYALTVMKAGAKLVPADASKSRHPGSFRAGPGIVMGEAVTVSQIISYLDRLLDRQLIDKTRLTGYFDFELKFAPESAPRALSAASQATGSGVEPQESPDAALFTAIQEQLGLKLEPRKERIEVLVIDSAQKPIAN